MNSENMLTDIICTILQEVCASLPERNVVDARELLEHSEWGESLSLICTQLYEYDVSISAQTYARIQQAGEQMGMSSDEWTMLKALVRSGGV